MSLLPEPIWFSARPNESRVCGGCHEDRVKTTVVDPGVTQAFAIGPTDARGTAARHTRMSSLADLANANLISTQNGKTVGDDKLVGMAWDKALQPMFDAKCVSCHDGSASAANPLYTISTADGSESVTWRFDLRSTKKPLVLDGMDLAGEWPASYFSLAGPDMEALEKGDLVISGDFKVYLKPQDARDSILIKKVNPTQLYPAPSGTRAFPTSPHSSVGYPELTSAEFLKLILAADMGVNYYARENNPGTASY
ncbi:MAG TPA: hypothetical protein VK427_05535, partial [Kofleriaceae bacterium]|nr:hypothetical protein [Kofleriaceae bacterium]